MLSATDALRVTQPPNNSFAAIGNEKEVSLLVVTTAYPHCLKTDNNYAQLISRTSVAICAIVRPCKCIC